MKKSFFLVFLMILISSLSARVMFVNHLLEKYDNIEELIYEGFLGNLDVEINKIKLHLANGRKTFAMVF